MRSEALNKWLAAAAFSLASGSVVAGPLVGTTVTVKFDDNSDGSSPLYTNTTTVGAGPEGVFGSPLEYSVDLSNTQIVLGLSLPAALGVIGLSNFYWVIDLSPGANISAVTEVSDNFPAGASVFSFSADDVTLQINPISGLGPFNLTAVYDLSFRDTGSVPEPSALALLGLGLVGLGMARRKRS